jgi:hypothetical protein
MATVRIKARSNAADFAGTMVDWAKQFQFANVKTLTQVAYKAKDDEYDEMRRAFDRPTPFTMNSLFVQGATRQKPEAIVRTKDGFNSVPAGAFLNPNVDGTVRSKKSHEKKLGAYTVPSKFAELDSYGNIPGATYRKIVSNLKLDEQSSTGSKTSKRKRAGEAYFRRGDIIFRRTTHTVEGKNFGAIIPVLIIVDDVPDYNKRLQFFEVALRARDYWYPKLFDRNFDQALATAR